MLSGSRSLSSQQGRKESVASFQTTASSPYRPSLSPVPRRDSGDESADGSSRRRRLARVLSEMEGGKSLAMAHEALSQTDVETEVHEPTTTEPIDDEHTKEAEKKAKRAEKRRRTIQELCETEASYAIDMAVVRDIYLARIRGVGESPHFRPLRLNR